MESHATQRARWSLGRPSGARIAEVLDAQRGLALTYAEVGHSLDRSPPGYAIDHNRVQLGSGTRDLAAARACLRGWRMFPAWTSVEPVTTPIERDRVVGVLIRAFGGWWLCAARIVYVIDEPRRFGFAYGTLPGHAECGEERFLVEQHEDDSVWYDLRAFSRPRHWAARVGYPVTRALQKRFARDSKTAMVGAMR